MIRRVKDCSLGCHCGYKASTWHVSVLAPGSATVDRAIGGCWTARRILYRRASCADECHQHLPIVARCPAVRPCATLRNEARKGVGRCELTACLPCEAHVRAGPAVRCE